METISILAQLIVAISVIIVWVFRYENIVLEFKQYGLSSLVRNAVGASKIALATVLILGIWYTEFLIPASLLMAVLMIGAQYCHVKVKNPLVKFVPSFILLLLCFFIAAFNYGLIQRMDLNLSILLFSAISFIFYGITSFFSKRMLSEYARWGYKNQRILLGCLQLLGGVGLLVGIINSTLLIIASFLLTFMMITAVFVRIKIKDNIIQMSPAIFYTVLNFIILYNSLAQLLRDKAVALNTANALI